MHTWEQIKYTYDKKKKKLVKVVIGSFRQFPIKLGWAITIHKSQGMTIDHATIDLSENFFQPGMLYTAFSRVRDSSDINIIGGHINSNILKRPSAKVLEIEEELGIKDI